MDQLIKDVRHSLRALARQPGFTLVAILTLGLGLGATTAIFSVVRASLLAPLPWSEPDRRVMIWSRWRGWDKTWVSSAEVRDYRAARSLRGVAAWGSGQVNLTGTGEPERVGAGQATANVFDVLGARPLIGRGFQHGEDASGTGARVVVLSFSLWQRRFGADPSVVGRTIQIDGAGYEVIGVMPKDFRLPTDFSEDFEEPTELWTPLVLDPDPNDRGNHSFYAAARPGSRLHRRAGLRGSHRHGPRADGARPLSQADAVRAVRGVAGGRSARARASRVGAALCRDGAAAPHRVRERGEPSARATGEPAARTGRAHGARRGALASASARC